jgi:hypothetical protein
LSPAGTVDVVVVDVLVVLGVEVLVVDVDVLGGNVVVVVVDVVVVLDVVVVGDVVDVDVGVVVEDDVVLAAAVVLAPVRVMVAVAGEGTSTGTACAVHSATVTTVTSWRCSVRTMLLRFDSLRINPAPTSSVSVAYRPCWAL